MQRARKRPSDIYDINKVAEIFMEEAINAGLPAASRLAWLHILNLEGGSPFKVYVEGNKTRSYGPFQINDARRAGVTALGLKFPDDIVAKRDMPAEEIERRIRNQVKYVLHYDKTVRELLKKTNPQLYKLLEANDLSKLDDDAWKQIIGYYMAAWNAPAYAARVAKGDFSVLRAGVGPVYKLATPERRSEAFRNAVRMFQTSTQAYLRKKMEAVKEPLLRAVAPTSTKYIVSGQRYPQTQIAQDKVKDILLLPSLETSFVLAASEPQTLKEWSEVLRTEVPEAEKLIPPEAKDASPYIGALLILGDMMKRDSSLQHIWSVLPEKQKQRLLNEIVGASQKLRPIIGKPQELEKAKVEITAKLSNALEEDVGFFRNLLRAASAFGRNLMDIVGQTLKEAWGLFVKTGAYMYAPGAPPEYYRYMRQAASVAQKSREQIINSFKQKAKSKDMVERTAAQNLVAAMERDPVLSAAWGGFVKGLGRTIVDMFLGLGKVAASVGEAIPIKAIQKPASAFYGAVVGAQQYFNRVLGAQLPAEVVKLSKDPEFREQYREQAVHFFASQGLMSMLKLVGNRYEPTEEGWEHFASSVLTAQMYQMMDSEIGKRFGRDPTERWLVEAQLNDYQAFMPLVSMYGVGKALGKLMEIATKPLVEALRGSKNFAALTALNETGNVHAALKLSGAISTLKFSQRLPYYITGALISVLFPGHLVEKELLKGILNFRLRNIGGLSGLREIAKTEGAEVARKHLQEVLAPAMGATKMASSIITGAAYSLGGIPDILPTPEKIGAFLANTVVNMLFDAPRFVEGITDIYKGKKQLDPQILSHPLVSNLIANIYSEGLVTDMLRSGAWSRILEPHVTMLNRGITDINQLSRKISGGKGKVNIIATEALSIPAAATLRLRRMMEAWEITPEGFAPEHRRRFEEWLEIYHHYEDTKANMLRRHNVAEGEAPSGMTIAEFEERILANWDKKMLKKGSWMKRKDAHERTAEAMLALHALTFARSFAQWYALATGDNEAARDMFYNFVRLGFAAADEAKRKVGAFPVDGEAEEQLAWIRAVRDKSVTLFYQALPAALDIVKSATAHSLAAVATEAVVSAASARPVDAELAKERLKSAMRKVNEVARMYMPRAFEEVVRTDDVAGVVSRWEQSVEPLMRAELRKIYKDYDIYDSVKRFIQTTKPKPAKTEAEKSPWRLILNKIRALETALKSAETKTETAQRAVLDEVSFRMFKDIMPDEVVETERVSSHWEKKLFPEQSIKWAADVGKYIPPTTTEGYVSDKEIVMFAEPKTNLKWGLEMNRLAQEMRWGSEELAEVKEFMDFAASSIALAPFIDPDVVSMFLWRKDRDFPLILRVSPDAAREIVNAVSADFNWAVVDAGRVGKRTADTTDEVLLVLAPRDKFDDPEIMRFASMVRDIYWTQEIPKEWWNYFLDAISKIPLEQAPNLAYLFRYFRHIYYVPGLISRLNFPEGFRERRGGLIGSLTEEEFVRLTRTAASVAEHIRPLFEGFDEHLPEGLRRKFNRLERIYRQLIEPMVSRGPLSRISLAELRTLLFSSFFHAARASSQINYSHRSLSYFVARNLLPLNAYHATQIILERILSTTSTALLGKSIRFTAGEWKLIEDDSGLTVQMPLDEYNKFWVYYIARLQHSLTMFDIGREAPKTELNPAEVLVEYIASRNPEIGAKLKEMVPSFPLSGLEPVRKAGAFTIYPFMFPHIVSGVVEEKMQYISSLLRQKAQENPQFLEEIRSRFYPDKTREEVLTELERDFRTFLVFMSSVPVISSNTYMHNPIATAYVYPHYDNAVFYHDTSVLTSRVAFHEILHLLLPTFEHTVWVNEFAKLSREEVIELARFFLKAASYIASTDRVLPFSTPYYLTFIRMFKTLAETRRDITDFRTVTITDFDEYSSGIKGTLDGIETTLVATIMKSLPTDMPPRIAYSIINPVLRRIADVGEIFRQAREEASGPQRALARTAVLTEEERRIFGGMRSAIWGKAILDAHNALMDIYYLLSTGRFIDLGALSSLPPDVAEALHRVLINAGEELAGRLFSTVMQDIRIFGLPMERWHTFGLLAAGYSDIAVEATVTRKISYLGQPTELVSFTFTDFIDVLQRVATEEPAAFSKFIEILANIVPEKGEFDPVRFLVNKLLPLRSGVTSAEVIKALGDIGSLMSPVEGKPYPEFYKNVLLTIVLLGRKAQIYGNPLPDVMARISEETAKHEALGTYAYLEHRGAAPEGEFALFEARREADISGEALKKMIEKGILVPVEPPEEIWSAKDVLQRIEEALTERGVVDWDSLAARRIIEGMLKKMENEPAAQRAIEQLEMWRKGVRIGELSDFIRETLKLMRAAREEPAETVETILTNPQKLREVLEQATQVILREVEGRPITEWVQKPVTVGDYIKSVIAKVREPEIVEGKEVVNLSYPKVLSALAIHRADTDEITRFILTRPEFAPMTIYSTDLFRELAKYLQVIGIKHPVNDTLEFLSRISSDDIFIRLLENYAQFYDEFTRRVLDILERRGVSGIWEEYGTTEDEFRYRVLSLSSDELEKQAMLTASEFVDKLDNFLQETYQKEYTIAPQDRKKLTEVLGRAIFRDIITFLHSKNLFLSLQENARMTAAFLSVEEITQPFINIRELKDSQAVSVIPSETWDYFERSLEGRRGLREMWNSLSAIKSREEFSNAIEALVKEMSKTKPRVHGKSEYELPGAVILHAIEQQLKQREVLPQRAPSIVEELSVPELMHPIILTDIERKVSPAEARILKGFERSLGRMFAITERSLRDIDLLSVELPLAIPGEPSFAEQFIFRSFEPIRKGVEIGGVTHDLFREEKIAVFHEVVSRILLNPQNPKNLNEIPRSSEVLRKNLEEFKGWLDRNWKDIESEIRKQLVPQPIPEPKRRGKVPERLTPTFAERFRRERPIPAVTFAEEQIVLRPRKDIRLERLSQTKSIITSAIDAFADTLARNYERWVEDGVARPLPDILSEIVFSDLFRHIPEELQPYSPIHLLPEEAKGQIVGAMRQAALMKIMERFISKYGEVKERPVWGGITERRVVWKVPEIKRPWLDIVEPQRKHIVEAIVKYMLDPNNKQVWSELSNQVKQIVGDAEWVDMNIQAKQAAEFVDMIYRYTSMETTPVAPFERKPAVGVTATEFVEHTKGFVDELYRNGWITKKLHEEAVETFKELKTEFTEGVSSEVVLSNPNFAKIINAVGSQMFYYLLKQIGEEWVVARELRGEAAKLRQIYSDYLKFRTPYTLPATEKVDNLMARYFEIYELMPKTLKDRLRREGVKVQSASKIRTALIGIIDNQLRQIIDLWQIDRNEAPVVERIIMGLEELLSYYDSLLQDLVEGKSHIAKRVGLYNYAGAEEREDIADFVGRVYNILDEAVRATDAFFKAHELAKSIEIEARKQLSPDPLTGLKKLVASLDVPVTFTGEMRKKIKNGIDFVANHSLPSDRIILELVRDFLVPPAKSGVSEPADMYHAIYGHDAPAVLEGLGGEVDISIGDKVRERLLQLSQVYESMLKEAERGEWAEIVKSMQERHPELKQYISATDVARARLAKFEIDKLLKTLDEEAVTFPGLVHLSEDAMKQQWTQNLLETIGRAVIRAKTMQKVGDAFTNLPPEVVGIIRITLNEAAALQKRIRIKSGEEAARRGNQAGFAYKQLVLGLAGVAALATAGIHLPELIRDTFGGISSMVSHAMTTPAWLALAFGGAAKLALILKNKYGVNISRVLTGLASSLSRWATHYKSQVDQIKEQTKNTIIAMVRETHGDVGAVVAEEVLSQIQEPSAYDIAETAKARYEQVVTLRNEFIGTKPRRGLTTRQMAADIVNTTAVNVILDKASDLGKALHDFAAAAEMKLLLETALPVFMASPENHERVVMSAATRFALRVLGRVGPAALGKKLPELKKRPTPTTLIGATITDPVTGQKNRVKITDDFEVTVMEGGQRVKKKISDMTILEILQHGLAGKVAPSDLFALTQITDERQLKQHIEMLVNQHSAAVRNDLIEALSAIVAQSPEKLAAIKQVSGIIRPIAKQLLRATKEGDLAAALAVSPEVQAMFLLNLRKLQRLLQVPHIRDMFISIGFDTDRIVAGIEDAMNTLRQSGISTQIIDEIGEAVGRWSYHWNEFMKKAMASNMSPESVVRAARDALQRLVAQIDRATRKRKGLIYTRYTELQKQFKTKKLPLILGSPFLALEADLRSSMVNAFAEPFNERIFNATLSLFPAEVGSKPEVIALNELLSSGKFTPMQMFDALDKQIDGLLAQLAQHVKVSKDELNADFNKLLHSLYRNSHVDNEIHVSSFEDVFRNGLAGLVYADHFRLSKIQNEGHRQIVQKLEGLAFAYLALLDYLTRLHSMKAYLGGILAQGMPDFIMTEERYFPQWGDVFHDPNAYLQTFLEEAFGTRRIFGRTPKSLPKQPFEHPRTGRATVRDEEFRPMMRRALNSLITKEVFDKHRPLIRGMLAFAPSEVAGLLSWHLVNALVPHKLADAPSEIFPVAIAEDASKMITTALSLVGDFSSRLMQEMREVGETDPTWLQKILTAFQSTVLLANPRSPLRQVFSLPYAGARLARDFNDPMLKILPALLFPQAVKTIFMLAMGKQPKLDIIDQAILDNAPALKARWVVTSRAKLQGAKEVLREVLSDPQADALVSTLLDPQADAEAKKAAERQLRGMFMMGGNPTWWKNVFSKIADWGFLALKVMDEAAVLASMKAATLAYLAHEKPYFDYTYQDIQAALHYAAAAAEAHHATPLEGYRPTAFRSGSTFGASLLFVPQVFSQFVIYTFAASENIRTLLSDVADVVVRKDLPLEKRIDNAATALGLIALLQLAAAALNGIFLGLAGKVLEEPAFGLYTREEEAKLTLDSALAHILGSAKAATPRPVSLAVAMVLNAAFRSATIRKTLPATVTERDMPPLLQLGVRILSSTINALSNIGNYTDIPSEHANFLQDTIDKILLTMPKRQRYGAILDIVHAALVLGSLKIPELQNIPVGLIGSGMRAITHHGELPYPAELSETFARMPREVAAGAHFLMGTPSPYGWSEWMSPSPADLAFRSGQRRAEDMALLFVENTERSSVPVYVAELLRIIPTLRPGATMNAVGLLLSPNFYVNIAKGYGGKMAEGISKTHPMVYHVSQFYDALQKDTESEFIDWIYNHPREFAWMTAMWGYDFIMRNWMWGAARRDWHDAYRNTDLLVNALVTRGMNTAVAQYLKEIAEKSNEANLREFYFKHKAEMQKQYEFRKRARILRRAGD